MTGLTELLDPRRPAQKKEGKTDGAPFGLHPAFFRRPTPQQHSAEMMKQERAVRSRAARLLSLHDHLPRMLLESA